jgi:xylulokinase
MGKLLLGIDIGTYSSKGVLCRPNGEIIAQAVVEHGISIPQPGFAEHDPDAIWWADLCVISKNLTAKVTTGDQVVGVAVSALGACLLPVDERGKPLRPAILYGIDTRAVPQIEELEQEYSSKSLIEFSGMRLSTQSIGPKILWIKQNEPDIYNQTHKFLTSTSYLIHKLTDEFVIDISTATEFNPLINIRSLEWDDTFAGGIVTLEKLPRLGWSDQIAGQIIPSAQAATGIPVGTPVTFGTVDAISEAVSIGVVHPGQLMIMYGSTAFLIFLIKKPVPTEELWLEAGAFKGVYSYQAGLSTSGSATTWFRDQFAKDLINKETTGGKNAYAILATEAAASPVGSNGLLMLPYLSGERTPIFDPNARGIIAGLALHHTRADIYRSILEGTAYAIRMNLEVMGAAGADFSFATAVGGGTANELWLQTVSDVSGISQVIPEKTIGASYGDAFLAGLAVGAVSGLDAVNRDWVSIKKKIIPDPNNKPDYDHLYTLFKDLYQSSKNVVHQLAHLQNKKRP